MTDIIHVSHSYRCDRRTRILGEAYPVVKIADEAIREALKALELIANMKDDVGLRDDASDLRQSLTEALRDCRWNAHVEEGRSCYNEAAVRPMKKGTRPCK